MAGCRWGLCDKGGYGDAGEGDTDVFFLICLARAGDGLEMEVGWELRWVLNVGLSVVCVWFV